MGNPEPRKAKLLIFWLAALLLLACNAVQIRFDAPASPTPTLPIRTSNPLPKPATATAMSAGGASASPAGIDCIPPGEWQTGRVVKVTDGDTIHVEIDGREFTVRYIGIDTPEDTREKEFFGGEATARNRALVEGKEVRLARDVSEIDRYGRLLRFVFVDGRFVNYILVREGFAQAVTFPPDVSCIPAFLEAEAEARADLAGLWGAATPAAGAGAAPGVTIRLVSYRGLAQHEADEFVELFNAGPQAVNLGAWTLHDESNHVFTFPAYSLAPGAACRVYTNELHPESCGFSFGNTGSGVWNNSGDCARLHDAAGELVAEFCY